MYDIILMYHEYRQDSRKKEKFNTILAEKWVKIMERHAEIYIKNVFAEKICDRTETEEIIWQQ